jgi:hypothetical protein
MMQHPGFGLQAPCGFGLDPLEGMLHAVPIRSIPRGEVDHRTFPVGPIEVSDDWEHLWIDLGGEG